MTILAQRHALGVVPRDLSLLSVGDCHLPTRSLAAAAALPSWTASEGPYDCRFATSVVDLDAVLRLRFEVFNLELGEGLSASFATGRDEDELDAWCHHLVVEERLTGRVVGTYRMQTADMAAAGLGFYTASEFDFARPVEDGRGGAAALAALLAESVEVGRACIAREHRRKTVLYLLWRGLAAYVAYNRKRFCFGCCSLTSQDPSDGVAAAATLARRGVLDAAIRLPPMPGYECVAEAPAPDAPVIRLPDLFEIYLRYGAKVCGPPALDRRFGTIDFLVSLDVDGLDERARRRFFGGPSASLAAGI
jgi:putative hemolysin